MTKNEVMQIAGTEAARVLKAATVSDMDSLLATVTKDEQEFLERRQFHPLSELACDIISGVRGWEGEEKLKALLIIVLYQYRGHKECQKLEN